VVERGGFGRFAEPARLVLAALRDGPRQHVPLFDDVRALDGPVGPGTLYAAVARLERLGLIEPITSGGRRAYRLTGSAPTGDLVTAIQGVPQ
jgi:DNA-binding PadR family transcriptional regulator